jgi:hypothetical protein
MNRLSSGFVNRRLEVQFLSPAPQLTRLPLQVCYHFATTSSRLDFIEPIHRPFIPHREPFAIGIDGELNARESELALHISRRLPLLQHQARIGMAETMRLPLQNLTQRVDSYPYANHLLQTHRL